jgi:hypothetical protein
LAISNPSREAILSRIREGLRTPAPPIEDKTFYGPIFEAVVNPLERFQQECKANLMECELTADAAGSAQTLAKVLQSLPEGEVFVQDDPKLRRQPPVRNGRFAGQARAGRWRNRKPPSPWLMR